MCVKIHEGDRECPNCPDEAPKQTMLKEYAMCGNLFCNSRYMTIWLGGIYRECLHCGYSNLRSWWTNGRMGNL